MHADLGVASCRGERWSCGNLLWCLCSFNLSWKVFERLHRVIRRKSGVMLGHAFLKLCCVHTFFICTFKMLAAAKFLHWFLRQICCGPQILYFISLRCSLRQSFYSWILQQICCEPQLHIQIADECHDVLGLTHMMVRAGSESGEHFSSTCSAPAQHGGAMMSKVWWLGAKNDLAQQSNFKTAYY